MSRYSSPPPNPSGRVTAASATAAKAGAVPPSVRSDSAAVPRKRKRSAPVKGTPRLLSTAQAAEYLGVSQNTIRKYRDEGKIPAFLVGARLVKYSREDLDAFLSKFGE